MTMTITDAFDLPRPEDIRAMGFVVKLREADPGSIRGDLAIGTGRNLIHASDSQKSGKAEVANFFDDNELFDYDKSEYIHIYEPHERA